jgi:hypothetical protein
MIPRFERFKRGKRRLKRRGEFSRYLSGTGGGEGEDSAAVPATWVAEIARAKWE